MQAGRENQLRLLNEKFDDNFCSAKYITWTKLDQAEENFVVG